MAKIRCKCGNILSDVEVPNDIQLGVYTDRQWENEINIGMINSVEIPSPKYDVWRCPMYERIYLFEDGNDKAIKTYVLEE